MTDSFFSYNKIKKDEKNIEDSIGDLSQTIAHMIVQNMLDELKNTKMLENDSRDFKRMLEDEISKFDSIEEVRYLGNYLVDLWRKTHEI